MDNDSVVEQIVRSLSFEVEATPQDNVIHLTTSTKSAPLNVKIRVRKKEEASFKHGVMSLPKPDRADSIPERVRLVSSDQTIMSFNVVMEADFQKPVKKPRKNFLGIFKPTVCLGAQPDEDDYAYLPSNSYTASINKESTSKSEGALTKFTLLKSVDNNETTTTLPKRKNDIFGKCKPGGCLDPPFSEEKQPYTPAKVDEQAAKTNENVTKNRQIVGLTAERPRTSSLFSNKIFNWKRKSANEEALDDNVIKTKTRAESILDLYQAGSVQASTTFSNSIMTYPPTLNSSEQLRIHEEKQRGSRIYNDPPGHSFSVHSGSYFIMPRKPKNVLDKNNTARIEDDSDLKVDTIHKNSEDQNNIAKRQDIKDDETKQISGTKDSFIDDQDGTEGNFMESSGSKKNLDPNHELTDNFVDTFNPLLTQISLKNISTQGQEDLSISNINSVPDFVIENKKPVKSNTSLVKKYSSEYKAEPIVEIKKSMIVGEIKLLDTVSDHQNSWSLKESNLKINTAIKNTLQTPIEDENKAENSDITKDAQHKMSDYDNTSAFESNPKADLTLQTGSISLDKGLEDEGMMEIPTPIELINVKRDDLQQVWKNIIENPLTSETKAEPENEHTKRDNRIDELENENTNQDSVINEFNNKTEELDKINDQTEAQRVSSEDKLIEQKYEEVTQNGDNDIQDMILATTANDAIESKVKQNVLLENKTPLTLDKIDEIDSVLSQNLEDISFTTQTNTTTSLVTESEENSVTTVIGEFVSNLVTEQPQSNVKEDIIYFSQYAKTSATEQPQSNMKEDIIDFSQYAKTSATEQPESNVKEDIIDFSQYAKTSATEQPQGNVKEDIIDFSQYAKISATEQPQSNMKEDIIDFSQYGKTSATEQPQSNVKEDIIDFSQYAKTTAAITAQTQSQISINIRPDKRKVSDDYGAILTIDDIYDFDQNNDKSDVINDDMEGRTKQKQPQVNVDKITESIADQRKSEKYIYFDEELNEAKISQTDLQTKLDRKPDSQRTETGFEIHKRFPNEQSEQNETQTFEIRPKHKVRPILFKLAIQSYVDDEKQVIIKSYDSDVAPNRYLHDSVSITKRYLEKDDRIEIPINSEIDLYIQIKSNTQNNISGMDNLDQDIIRKSAENQYESEIDHIKRNVIIVEDIRRTLEAVYEKELLPLRNTISELKENIEMLTMHHMVLKGHMFIKKPRSSKIFPLYRKCGCMKK